MISAILGAFIVLQRDPQALDDALLVYLCIHRHHGDLRDPLEILPEKSWLEGGPPFDKLIGTQSQSMIGELNAVQMQWDDLNQVERRSVVVSELAALGLSEIIQFLDTNEWWSVLGELRRYFARERGHRGRKLTAGPVDGAAPELSRWYWRLLLLFSALVDADKSTAAGAAWNDRREIPADAVRLYMRKLETESHPLGNLRRTVHSEAVEAVLTAPLGDLYPGRWCSITAPTGSGKTLTAFASALALRERVHKELGVLPRIIYALPFVNIIDQNYREIEAVLESYFGFSGNSLNRHAYLVKHHYMADPGGDESKPYDEWETEWQRQVETWDSEIIVTTFVQLFESLINVRNRSLRKLHNLAGSIIILDEVQAIPAEQWKLVSICLERICLLWGCTVLQMTATSPAIYENTLELLSNPRRYFRGLNRTVIRPRLEIRRIEQLVDLVLEEHARKQSVLVVVNTISTAVRIFELLRKRTTAPLFSLSTNIVPIERRRRIAEIEELLKRWNDAKKWGESGVAPIVVATQVIEAGVNLDFDAAVRDIGPFDSIVQVAGRVNRHALREQGPVYVTALERESDVEESLPTCEGRLEAEIVYGKILPYVTLRYLSNEVSESGLYDLVNAYFAEVKQSLADRGYLGYVAAMALLHMNGTGTLADYRRGKTPAVPIATYRYIRDEERVPVIVELEEDATKILDKLVKLVRAGCSDYQTLRRERRALAEYAISPSWRRVSEVGIPIHPELEGYYYVGRADLERCYDPMTGLKFVSLSPFM